MATDARFQTYMLNLGIHIIYIYIYICMYVCMYVCIYIYMCIYIYVSMNKHTQSTYYVVGLFEVSVVLSYLGPFRILQ